MFTGIIKSKGVIKEINIDELVIEAESQFKEKNIGDSISVNGVCLTITKIDKNNAHFNLMNETLKSTNLRNTKKGDVVNLEPALTFGQGLDGHLVQGHIDTTGEILEVRKESNQTTLRISYDKKHSYFLSLKGSVTINGVSLTISLLEENYFEVCLVKHTLAETNLSKIKKGDKVNIEFDTIAKYIKSLLDKKEAETKYEYLKDRGFI